MKKYMNMMLFVIVLGIVASGILVGMNALTDKRIEANKEVLFRQTVLDVFGIPYSIGQINEVYLAEVKVEEVEELSFYITENSIGYIVEGGGVWGPIIGFVALNEDFETIQKIDILQQEETPGLGGRIVESEFLDQFVGITMLPTLEINKDTSDNDANEVDAITGATRTSKSFEKIMNDEYLRYSGAWDKIMEKED